VHFGGALDLFQVLQGMASDLDNPQGLPAPELQQRLGMWLSELDRNHQNVLRATGVLGANGQRLARLEEDLLLSEVDTQGLLSGVEDADLGQVVLDMTRAEQALQLAQATSVRLLNTSLLNFLR
jgi:flagellin-like hook-associated protein FlgL